MKKVLSLVLALSLFISSSMTVFAEEELRGEGTMSVPINIDVQSQYIVSIPASINMYEGSEYTFTSNMMSITPEEVVGIYPPTQEVSVQNESGDTGNIRLYSNASDANGRVAYFVKGRLDSQITMTGQIDCTYPGHYTGTAVFTVKLEKIGNTGL